MIKLTDSSGNLFPALRNLLNLVWLISGIALGWFAHVNWAVRAEADQLVRDANQMVIIRKEKHNNEAKLAENIEDAKQLEASDCLHSQHESFVRKLRSGREKGFSLDQ